MLRKYFYVIAGIIIYMCVGSIYSWSVFRKPLEELFSITATQSGIPYMLFLLFFSLSMPIAGRFMERLGAFQTILLGNILFMAGFLISGIARDILVISLAYGVISGIGVGIIYGVPIAVAGKWLPEKRGLAMGLTLIGFGLSPFVTAPIIKNFINLYGPMRTFTLLGVLFFLIILVFSSFLKFPKSEERKEGSALSDKDSTPGKMIKTKEFYGLWICYMFGTFAGLMAIGITSPFAQEVIGLDGNTAAFFVSLFAVFNGVGRPLFGFLVDKMKPFKTILLAFMIIILASILGLTLKTGDVLLFTLVFSLFWLMLGGWLAIAPATTSTIFGSKYYSSNYGIVFTAYGTAAVVGSLLSGRLKDVLGSYVFSFYPALILAILGIMICLFTLRRKAA